MSYWILEGDEEAAVIADINARIPSLRKVGTIGPWEKGWGENLAAYNESGDVADLRPKYIRQGLPLRHHGRFVMADDPDAEWKEYERIRDQAFSWLEPCVEVHEFGCGSCHNLVYLGKEYRPDMMVYGYDWSWASVSIAKAVADGGRRFDFLNPTLPTFKERSAVLTIGALEQTGGRAWLGFMTELIEAKPHICIHLEPIIEWYDVHNPVDATAIAVHRAKGFWEGFWPWLRAQRKERKVEILEAHRTGFGSLMVEGYNLIVWRPL